MTKLEEQLYEICGDGGRYHARVLRTQVLREHAGAAVAQLLRAFVPDGFEIRIERDKLVVDGNKIVGRDQVYPFVAVLRDKRLSSDDPDEREAASDAHIAVYGQTLAGTLGKLLAHILDGGGFFPLT